MLQGVVSSICVYVCRGICVQVCLLLTARFDVNEDNAASAQQLWEQVRGDAFTHTHSLLRHSFCLGMGAERVASASLQNDAVRTMCVCVFVRVVCVCVCLYVCVNHDLSTV